MRFLAIVYFPAVSCGQAYVDFYNPTTELHQKYHDKGLKYIEENYDAVTKGGFQTDKLLSEAQQAEVQRKARERFFRWPHLDPQDVQDYRFNTGPQRFCTRGDPVALGDPMEEVYVVSLGRRPSKRRHAIDQLKSHGVNAKIVDAMDGDAVLYQSDVSSLGFELVRDYGWGYSGHSIAFSTGEVGCWMSHATIWHHMVENNIPAALILEDDFDFQPDFKRRLGEYWLEAEGENWDMMFIGRSPLEKDKGSISEHIKIPSYTLWTVGYIMKLELAQRLLETHAEKHVLPLDQFYSMSMGEAGPDCERAEEWFSQVPKTILRPLAMEPPLVMPYVGSMLESDTAMMRPGTRYLKDLPLRPLVSDGCEQLPRSPGQDELALEQLSLRPGRLGIVCDAKTGVITRVLDGGQAATKGIQAGWKFLHIDGREWSDSMMDEKVSGIKVYTAAFHVPIQACHES